MKRIRTCLALSVFALAGLASAATANSARFVLDEAAVVGRQTLPPGQYTIERVTTNGGHQYISFRGKNKTVLAVVSSSPDTTLAEPVSGVVLVAGADGQRVRKVALAGNVYRIP
ncbi:MAG: hypothetical protein HY820_27690 [Acidobacteria bacterium]|nr:hypothetical protein [Acidobacteriota bacterium]